MPILENDVLRKLMILVAAISIAIILQTVVVRAIKRIFEKGEVPMPENGDNEWSLPGRPWRQLPKDTPATNKATQGAPLGYRV